MSIQVTVVRAGRKKKLVSIPTMQTPGVTPEKPSLNLLTTATNRNKVGRLPKGLTQRKNETKVTKKKTKKKNSLFWDFILVLKFKYSFLIIIRHLNKICLRWAFNESVVKFVYWAFYFVLKVNKKICFFQEMTGKKNNELRRLEVLIKLPGCACLVDFFLHKFSVFDHG